MTPEQITITDEDRRIICDLIRLFHAAWENPHSRQCECTLCESLEKAGECSAKAFEGLEKKCGYEE